MRLLQHVEDGELDVLARERLAVMKLDAFLQLERDRLAVGAHRPRLREARNRLQIEVVLEEALVHLRRNLSDRPGGARVSRQRRRLRLHDHHQRSAPLGLRALRYSGSRQQERDEREHGSDRTKCADETKHRYSHAVTPTTSGPGK